MVVLIVVLRLPAAACAAALVLALVGGVALTVMGMIIDLARPLLQWTNPMKAIKQNLNVVFALLAELGVLAVIGYGLNILSKAGVSGNGLVLIALAVLVLLSWASYQFLQRFAERRYREIEV